MKKNDIFILKQFKRPYLVSSLKLLDYLLVSLIRIKHLLLAGVKQDLYRA